ASATVAGLATAALRQFAWLKLRAVGLFGAGIAALLLLAKVATLGLAPGERAGGSTSAEAERTPLLPGAGQERVSDVRPSAAKTESGKVFSLRVLAVEDNRPLPSTRVRLNCWGEGGVVHSADFQADANGICHIPIPV